jgi:hypothetical protein
MSYSIYCERSKPPSEEQIVQSIGSQIKVWSDIHSYLTQTVQAKAAWKFYGKNYGWASGYTKSGKSIISLYPLTNDFTVQMIIKKGHEDEIKKLTDNKELLSVIRETPEIHEGKWIFIPFSRLHSTELVLRMIDIKLRGNTSADRASIVFPGFHV